MENKTLEYGDNVYAILYNKYTPEYKDVQEAKFVAKTYWDGIAFAVINNGQRNVTVHLFDVFTTKKDALERAIFESKTTINVFREQTIRLKEIIEDFEAELKKET